MADEAVSEMKEVIDDEEVILTSVYVSVKEMIQMYERVADNINNTQYIEQSVMTIQPSTTNIETAIVDIENKKEVDPDQSTKMVSKFHSFNRFLPKKTFF